MLRTVQVGSAKSKLRKCISDFLLRNPEFIRDFFRQELSCAFLCLFQFAVELGLCWCIGCPLIRFLHAFRRLEAIRSSSNVLSDFRLSLRLLHYSSIFTFCRAASGRFRLCLIRCHCADRTCLDHRIKGKFCLSLFTGILRLQALISHLRR